MNLHAVNSPKCCYVEGRLEAFNLKLVGYFMSNYYENYGCVLEAPYKVWCIMHLCSVKLFLAALKNVAK